MRNRRGSKSFALKYDLGKTVTGGPVTFDGWSQHGAMDEMVTQAVCHTPNGSSCHALSIVEIGLLQKGGCNMSLRLMGTR
jgi:hypothetical protein